MFENLGVFHLFSLFFTRVIYQVQKLTEQHTRMVSNNLVFRNDQNIEAENTILARVFDWIKKQQTARHQMTGWQRNTREREWVRDVEKHQFNPSVYSFLPFTLI